MYWIEKDIEDRENNINDNNPLTYGYGWNDWGHKLMALFFLC
jgi:hypothetical protein